MHVECVRTAGHRLSLINSSSNCFQSALFPFCCYKCKHSVRWAVYLQAQTQQRHRAHSTSTNNNSLATANFIQIAISRKSQIRFFGTRPVYGFLNIVSRRWHAQPPKPIYNPRRRIKRLQPCTYYFHIYMHTYMYTCIYMYIYIYTHIQM